MLPSLHVFVNMDVPSLHVVMNMHVAGYVIKPDQDQNEDPPVQHWPK